MTNPTTKFVRSLDGTYYMLREAAELLGVTPRTLRNFQQDADHDLKPSFLAFFGKVKVYLYTDDDLRKIREYMEERRTVYPMGTPAPLPIGRPAKFTKEERAERQKLYSKAHYYSKRAKAETEKGNLKKASEYLAKQRAIKKELKDNGK